MATASISDSQLRIMLNAGNDGEGNPIVKYKTFNNVKTSATADQLYTIVGAIVPLQMHGLGLVERNDSFTITPV